MPQTIPIYNVTFPTTIATTAKGLMRFRNRGHDGEGGDVANSGVWERPLGRWLIETIFYEAANDSAITPADIQKAIDIFYWSKRYNRGFWFQPPADHVVRSGQGIFTGGEYFRRHEPAAGLIYDRPVVPNPSGLSVVGATWTGKIRVPALFGTDELEGEFDGDGDMGVLPALEIVEVPNYNVVA